MTFIVGLAVGLLVGGISVLVVNEHELRAIVGGAIPTAPSEPDLADALATLEVPRVVVTLGGRGALSRDDDGTVRRHPAPVVDAVDTTGCGDAFLGALAAGLLGGGGFCDAVDTAVVVGAFAATRSGAQPSYPTREELDSWPRP